MKKTICLMLAALLLTGCAEVPEAVQNEIGNYHSEGDAEHTNTGFEYIDTAEIAQDMAKAIGRDYGQFHISGQIRPTAPDALYLMQFAKTAHFTAQFDRAMSLFFSGSALAGRETVRDDEGNMFFDDAEARVYGCVGDDGFIAMLKPDVYDISYSYSEPTVHIYHPARNENLSDAYALADGECSVADAVDFVNDWLEQSYHALSPDFTHEAETVIVREHEGKYLYEILVRARRKNVPLDSYTQDFDRDGPHPQLLKYTNYGIQIQMVKSGKIASFTNLCGIFQPTETEQVRQCISLQSALAYCAETFTDFQNLTVSDIQPMYTVEPEYTETKPGVFVLTGYHSRPVWALAIDVPPAEFLKSGEVNTYGDMRKYIYVDMLTGKLHYNFETVFRK